MRLATVVQFLCVLLAFVLAFPSRSVASADSNDVAVQSESVEVTDNRKCFSDCDKIPNWSPYKIQCLLACQAWCKVHACATEHNELEEVVLVDVQNNRKCFSDCDKIPNWSPYNIQCLLACQAWCQVHACATELNELKEPDVVSVDVQDSRKCFSDCDKIPNWSPYKIQCLQACQAWCQVHACATEHNELEDGIVLVDVQDNRNCFSDCGKIPNSSPQYKMECLQECQAWCAVHPCVTDTDSPVEEEDLH